MEEFRSGASDRLRRSAIFPAFEKGRTRFAVGGGAEAIPSDVSEMRRTEAFGQNFHDWVKVRSGAVQPASCNPCDYNLFQEARGV